MFSHFFVLSPYTCHIKNLIVSVHCIDCLCVLVMFPFSNMDLPVSCFQEVIKLPPLLLASDVDNVLKNKIMSQGHS